MATSTTRTIPVGVRASLVLPEAQTFGGFDPYVTSITARPDAVRSGDVFVAFEERCPSVEVIREAIAAGAVVIVSESMQPIFDVPQLVVDDAREAYALLCQALMQNPADQLQVAAVAGSHGKTSTTILLNAILHAAEHSSACFTNRVNFIACEPRNMPASTDAASIAHNLAEAAANESRQVVMEASEEAIANRQFAGVELDMLCLTNLFADNAGRDTSPLASRGRMLQAVEHLAPHGVLVANADDVDCQRFLADYDGPVVTFGENQRATVQACVVEEHPGETTFLLSVDNETVTVTTPIVGHLHVANCLAAAAMATAWGIDLGDIARGLAAVVKLPGVMQRVAVSLDYAAYVDSSRSPEALRACLADARRTTSGRLIAVVPGQSVATQSVATALADAQINGERSAELPKTIRSLLSEMAGEKKDRQLLARLSAVAAAALEASPGDTIVVSGCRSRLANPQRVDESALIEHLLCTIAHQRSLPAAA